MLVPNASVTLRDYDSSISMILTSSQHRKLAKLLRQKAPEFEYRKRLLAHKQAAVHLALARAQERNPALRPKKKYEAKA